MNRPSQIELLIVEDDDDFRQMLSERLSRTGFQVQSAADGEQAWGLFQRREFDVAVCDLMMPGMSGLTLLEKARDQSVECEVIVLTGQGTIESAVQAMKLGAYDYLTKPFPLKDLEALIEKACERRQLRKENRQLRTLLERSEPTMEMIGASPAMREVFRLIERAAPSDKPILIQGESGTGKELVARALHRHSLRTDKPLVVINCAALPESLLESELFGHEKGSFTGAVGMKQGLFEVADGGTLFIDEIGEMPGSLQAKLLRVLEDGRIRRVGSVKERRVDVRLLAATNRNLAEEVKAGGFREDLYYRINVMSLELPPLRERKEDVALLVQHFLGPDWNIEDEAFERIEAYDWPGNVRQLINAIERGKIMADGITVRACDLPHEILAGSGGSSLPVVPGDVDKLATTERAKVVDILRREEGNKTRTARVLGIDRRKLYRLIEKYDIQDAEL